MMKLQSLKEQSNSDLESRESAKSNFSKTQVQDFAQIRGELPKVTVPIPSRLRM